MTYRLTFTGIVQGIGFRPAAQRIASKLKITGYVKNTGGNTEVIITGSEQALDSFVRRLIALFEIKGFDCEKLDEIHYDTFTIEHSSRDRKTPFLTPDIATCADCEKELKDKRNRRYAHPFISCVNCGPRYTIIKSLPYDRENTAMSDFDMCEKCKEEYISPENRRCHAQTIACNDCPPSTNISIDTAVNILKSGEVLAIKDIGGYHLACRADCPESVNKIREIKGRETKPFAVMFHSTEQIKEYCKLNRQEEELLISPARPIVLLEKIKDFDLSVDSGSDYTGAFLPCNPIQIMLLEECSPLVMTSANRSGEPIITDDGKIQKLGVKCLSHNREILTPLDDSVLKITCGRTQFIRRARGYTPLAIDIGIKAKADTLCLGGDLKAVFGFHRDHYVFLSQYFGDLENSLVMQAYKANIKRFARLHSFTIEKTVCDSHPQYYSSNLYKNNIKVQHHKAHIASVIAEHHLKGKVLGFAFDGTGFGDDGAVWGSEVIRFDGKNFCRLNHLDYVKMPASDEISKNADLALACYTGTNNIINAAVRHTVNTVESSSMGRLFDAVCSVLDICHYNRYEGECAVKLESAAKHAKKPHYITPSWSPCSIIEEIKTAPAAKEEIALGFHLMLSELILQSAKEYGISQIVLCGGVFNNRIVTENTINKLEENGFSVYINEKVPCGDGSLALGQAYISALEE